MNGKKINVLVVDDSQVSREVIAHIINSDPELRVMGMVNSGIEALHWLETHTPDVITLDVQMPAINGFEVTRRIMESRPIPIVIITSSFTAPNVEMAFTAMEAGALFILEKPVGIGLKNYERQAQEIIRIIKTVAGVKLVKRKKILSQAESKIPIIADDHLEEMRAVAIGASLGGPPAVAEVLSRLPANFPIPIFIVQHIAIGFMTQLIVWLQERCSLPIQAARNGEKALGGHVYLAPDQFHMKVLKGDIITLTTSSDTGPQPSVSNLFKSMADTYGSHCIGVILTGMGRDGAEELLLMKQKGAYTIAQSEESCLMFGMPREAISIGAAKQVLPLEKIASALIYLTSQGSEG